MLRIENSKHLSNIYSYLISILIYILYYTILYTILYTIHTIYTIYFYEVNPLCIQPYILTCVLHHIHLFWDDFSLLSIHQIPHFPYPHARLLLTNALSIVNMQYLPCMTFVSFPIAHSPHPVNHLSYVSYLTLLLLGDDTPDVIPRHTMLRHTQYISANRNFRLNPKEVSGLSSLDPTIILCIPASMCSASRAGETSARATQEHASEATKRMSTPRPIPTH